MNDFGFKNTKIDIYKHYSTLEKYYWFFTIQQHKNYENSQILFFNVSKKTLELVKYVSILNISMSFDFRFFSITNYCITVKKDLIFFSKKYFHPHK